MCILTSSLCMWCDLAHAEHANLIRPCYRIESPHQTHNGKQGTCVYILLPLPEGTCTQGTKGRSQMSERGRYDKRSVHTLWLLGCRAGCSMCACVCWCVHVPVCVCTSMCMCVWTSMCVCVWTSMCVCVDMCVYHVCMLCMCIYTCAFMCVCTCTRVCRAHVHMHVCMSMCVCICMCA